GRFYSADGARSIPGCVQRPRVPFAIAGVGPRAMRVAARHGETWVTAGDITRDNTELSRGVEGVRQQIVVLEEVCDEPDREPAPLRRLVLTGPNLDPGLGSLEQFRDTIGAYEAVGITDFVVHWPRESEPYEADLAVFEKIAAALTKEEGTP